MDVQVNPIDTQQRCIGLVRVSLQALVFEDSRHGSLSETNVTRLQRIFEVEGCQRTQPRNFIDVVLDREDINHATCMPASSSTQLDWATAPRLPIERVRCLTGLHRIRAAERYLAPNDQWWIARIYTSDTDDQTRRQLAEEYSNERAHGDGEILHKIRSCHKRGDRDNENKWLARLTESKRKDLRQLLRDHRFAAALDDLLPWFGLWQPIQLGTLHRLLTMKCDEELLNYLAHVRSVWSGITRGIVESAVDSPTVESLHSLAPRWSSADAQRIELLVDDTHFFPGISRDIVRNSVLPNIKGVATAIPSLFTFFEDIKYLEPCARIMRRLLPSSTTNARNGLSIQLGLKRHHFPTTDAVISVDYAHGDMRNQHAAECDKFTLQYQQLWLFAIRNFTRMTNTTARKERKKVRPMAVEPSPIVWREFGHLAWLCGFRTEESEQLRQHDREGEVVRQLFQQHGYRTEAHPAAMQQVADLIRSLGQRRGLLVEPNFACERDLALAQRCGRPYEDDHRLDSPCMFLPQIYAAPQLQSVYVSSFFRKWAMARMFLGIGLTTNIVFNAPTQHADPMDFENISPQESLVRDLRAELANTKRSWDITRRQHEETSTRFREMLQAKEERDREILAAQVARDRANQDCEAQASKIQQMTAEMGQLEVRNAQARAELLEQYRVEMSRISEQLRLQAKETTRKTDHGVSLERMLHTTAQEVPYSSDQYRTELTSLTARLRSATDENAELSRQLSCVENERAQLLLQYDCDREAAARSVQSLADDILKVKESEANAHKKLTRASNEITALLSTRDQ
ncbi:hypothetical protein LTR95_015037 [Oleoguttula sp. CCFEE 5521]